MTRKNVYCLASVTSTLGQSVKRHYPVSSAGRLLWRSDVNRKECSLRTLRVEKRQILMWCPKTFHAYLRWSDAENENMVLCSCFYPCVHIYKGVSLGNACGEASKQATFSCLLPHSVHEVKGRQRDPPTPWQVPSLGETECHRQSLDCFCCGHNHFWAGRLAFLLTTRCNSTYKRESTGDKNNKNVAITTLGQALFANANLQENVMMKHVFCLLWCSPKHEP